MPYDEDQIANLEADVDDLVTPTTEDVLAFSQDYDAGIVAASALQKSLNGGGGGGSFNGGTITELLTISPAAGPALELVAPAGSSSLVSGFDSDGNYGFVIDAKGYLYLAVKGDASASIRVQDEAFATIFEVGPTGAVTISPTADEDTLTLQAGGDNANLLSAFNNIGTVLTVGPTGAVTISPSDENDTNLTLTPSGTADNDATVISSETPESTARFQYNAGGELSVVGGYDGAIVLGLTAGAINETGTLLRARGTDGSSVLTVGPTGAVTISPSDETAQALEMTVVADAVTNGQPIIGVDSGAGSLLRFDGNSVLAIHSRSPNGGGSLALYAGDDNKVQMQADDGAGVSSVDFQTDTVRFEAATDLGFFGATPTAQPTGVTVDAAGIHAALVTLGLITA